MSATEQQMELPDSQQSLLADYCHHAVIFYIHASSPAVLKADGSGVRLTPPDACLTKHERL